MPVLVLDLMVIAFPSPRFKTYWTILFFAPSKVLVMGNPDNSDDISLTPTFSSLGTRSPFRLHLKDIVAKLKGSSRDVRVPEVCGIDAGRPDVNHETETGSKSRASHQQAVALCVIIKGCLSKCYKMRICTWWSRMGCGQQMRVDAFVSCGGSWLLQLTANGLVITCHCVQIGASSMSGP